MVAQLLGLAFLYLTTSLATFTANATKINQIGQVVYKDSRVYGVVNRAVILECGSTLPDHYIWIFKKPGTDRVIAVAYDIGKGPRVTTLSQTLGQLSVISNSASVSIERLNVAAHGLFVCQATYDKEPEPELIFYNVHLVVRVPIRNPELSISDVSPVEGSTVQMRCNLENGTGPIVYKWQHESSVGDITDFAQGNSSTINVTNVNRNHTGRYRCVASNAVNSESSKWVKLETIFGPDVPQIQVTPHSVTGRGYSALERDTVFLLCQAQSHPPSQYVWFYNKSQVFTGPNYNITNILRIHTGEYTCLAHNTYLNTRSRKTISLTVYSEPRFNIYPAVVGAAIGGMLFAAILTMLLLVYIIRNRNNNPRLHDLLFGSQHSQSRENINLPEDDGGSEGGIEEIGGSSSPAPALALPRAASPLTTSP
uniref:Ig-like domain-containing protein n=1 Tax=Amphiprion ocellaris TaxID=80972 RepID=A0AAQ6A640_AMPOC